MFALKAWQWELDTEMMSQIIIVPLPSNILKTHLVRIRAIKHIKMTSLWPVWCFITSNIQTANTCIVSLLCRTVWSVECDVDNQHWKSIWTKEMLGLHLLFFWCPSFIFHRGERKNLCLLILVRELFRENKLEKTEEAGGHGILLYTDWWGDHAGWLILRQ